MAYALHELLFDLTFMAREHFQVDIEGLFILCCVNEATMRPLVLTPASPEALTASRPPDEIRGSISRRAIADRTGLPRETVRRKVQELVDRGLVMIDPHDRVRSIQALAEPTVQNVIQQGHRAVTRYHERLRLTEDAKPR